VSWCPDYKAAAQHRDELQAIADARLVLIDLIGARAADAQTQQHAQYGYAFLKPYLHFKHRVEVRKLKGWAIYRNATRCGDVYHFTFIVGSRSNQFRWLLRPDSFYK